ncbi:hypothetical protein ACFSKL_14075 [Belliella marina]|uniref:Uncharacterized protein n=1 Tax=Belliella marina TaxID=1644146 RepID=A0ABW4VMJ1_9BACT
MKQDKKARNKCPEMPFPYRKHSAEACPAELRGGLVPSLKQEGEN